MSLTSSSRLAELKAYLLKKRDQIQNLFRLKTEPWEDRGHLKMEPWRIFIRAGADYHHFDEKQDADSDPH
jgi:hypothetical protein